MVIAASLALGRYGIVRQAVIVAPMTLRIALLGPPRITRDGEPISFETRKATALLAHLALTEHPPLTRGAL